MSKRPRDQEKEEVSVKVARTEADLKSSSDEESSSGESSSIDSTCCVECVECGKDVLLRKEFLYYKHVSGILDYTGRSDDVIMADFRRDMKEGDYTCQHCSDYS